MKAADRQAYEVVTRRDVQCVRCGSHDRLERDHRKNRSQGGPTRASNLQLLCAPCHRWKTANPENARRSGFAVPGWARPFDWPAYRQTALGGYWCLYGDDGLVELITAERARELMGLNE